MDWGKNEYFNCSSPSVEHCGVPFSCCINATDISVNFLISSMKNYTKIYLYILLFAEWTRKYNVWIQRQSLNSSCI